MIAPLLIELFTEELPPKALKKLGDSFAAGIFDGLKKRGLLAANSVATMFASPRRLAVHITNVGTIAPDETVIRKLMPSSVGLDADGKPTQALIKKLTSLGRLDFDVSMLEREGEGKAQQLLLRDLAKGQSLLVALQTALEETIEALPVPKMMNYQLADGKTPAQFVRPAHGLVALHGVDVVPVHALGLDAGRTTHGHRFQGAADIELKHADEYESRLENEGGVIASFEKRRGEIMRLLLAHAEQAGDTMGEAEDYSPLLDEVTGLVERPTVYVGKFDAEFLEVPAECLVLTMKLNQKYFPLFLSEGGLSSRFLIVSNMRLDNPQNVIEGNERVVRPRLADARFFFETDKKTKLADRVPRLANMVYHAKLGSQLDRTERVQKIAGWVANRVGIDSIVAEKAARLAKADLLTEMVGEFPELQGIMGAHYAEHDGESSDVVNALRDQYMVRRRESVDDEPEESGESLLSDVLIIADRVETLVGIWGAGLKPTGDKDPFALRRSALAIIGSFEMINATAQISKSPIDLPLRGLLQFAESTFPPRFALASETVVEVENFVYERIANQLAALFNTNQVSAVVSIRPPLQEIPRRLKAVRVFAGMLESESLAAANKRIGNILKKSDQQFANADASLLLEPAEKSLHKALLDTKPTFDKHFAVGDYTNALKSLAPLKAPVDAFFEGVMVNAEDPKLRVNRLALLSDLHALMNKVADLSKLAA